MKRLLKSNHGMTLMEILVALSLLMIVIVGTTPIMLQAYNGLYTAGEYTQNVYNAKTEVEDQLAKRGSIKNYSGFTVNFENLGEVATVNAKRAVSSLENSLETLFSGARVRIYISSGSVVDDNQSDHSITLQTVNLEFDSKDDLSVNDKDNLSPEGKKIDITAYLPQKNATNSTAASVYNEDRKAEVAIVDDTTNPTAGRIGINISSDTYPIDFTTSPIKIIVTYLDENNKVKSVHTYLTIKTPTIMFAGNTSDSVTYYTSAGVKEIRDDNGTLIERTLEAEGRKMNIGYDTKSAGTRIVGAESTQVVPSNTVFKSINWITEFERTTGGSNNNEDIEYANTAYEPEYYVLTGTNGAIYRTYTFEDPNNIKGKVNINNSISDFGLNGLYLNTLTNQTQINQDVMGIKDTYIVLDDRASTVVYPAVWGGDFSHIYGWSAYGEEAGYTERVDPVNTNGTWYTQHSSDVTTSDSNRDGSGDTGIRGIGSEGFYSNLACYGYYYNGYALNAKYFSMNSRKISYILTEVPDALRVGGYMGGVGSASEYGYDGSTFDRVWERPMNPTTGASQKELGWSLDGVEREWFYATSDESFPRSAILKIKMKQSTTDSTTKIPVYLAEGGSVRTNRADNGIAQIRIKALTTLSPTIVYSRGENPDEPTDMRVAYDNDVNYSKIIVTDAVYIPAVGNTKAQVFYIGTVAAYSMINQVDNVGMSDDSPDVKEVGGHQTTNAGRLTSYWVVSDDTGTSATIYKHSTKDKYADEYYDWGEAATIKFNDLPHGSIRARLMDTTTRNSTLYSNSNTYGANSYDLTKAVKANSTESHQFFISQPLTANGDTYSEKVSGRVFSDVCFTMGYTSNREMVYTNIVYGKDSSGNLIQSLKFCEPYYFISHYGDENHNPNLYMNSTIDTGATTVGYRNHENNDYYNVWFPGEMYNLTKVATKDNVTVAVGYAVAGSTYTYLNSKENGSTGLGAIFNDGVVSGMVLGQDEAFKSLLYYKDNASMDKTSLTDGSVKFEQHNTSGANGSWINYTNIRSDWGDYGTHARDSVQFTCVDISVVPVGDYFAYYAYYADNKGRVFRSYVAYKHKDSSDINEMVTHISDATVTEPTVFREEKVGEIYNGNVGKMEQIYVNGNEPFTKYFSEIKAITCDDKHIVITGKSNDENFNIVIGTITPVYNDIKDDEGNVTGEKQIGVDITWKNVKMSGEGSSFIVENMAVIGNYVYAVGTTDSSTGFLWAAPVNYLDTLGHNGEIVPSGVTSDGKPTDGYFYCGVTMPIYAIAGKE